jgi:hypothetical protein
MIHRMSRWFGLVWIAAAGIYVESLKIKSQSIEGTEPLDYGLSDKQLGIQRYFAELTFLSSDINNWTNWGQSVHDVDCDGNTCIRYEIAGVAYAAALLGMKIPSYQQIAEKIMYNTIHRMFQSIVWQYIELFDDFKDQETYPDPVAYKNIMYSGHLVQMIAMFEAIFGNFTFSTNGWDFIWIDSITNETLVIHYNTSRLMSQVYEQSLAYGIYGVPCEPDSIFIICNNYPQNGWLLFDSLYQTNYSASAIPSWAKIVQQHGINHRPAPGSGSGSHPSPSSSKTETETAEVDSLENYFKLDYLIKPLGIWEPIATIGSDLWALSWMKTWWPVEAFPLSLQSAFDFILESSCWSQVTSETKRGKDDEEHGEEEEGALFPYSYLHPSEQYQKLFPFNDMITTSFYPLIERQFLSSKASIEVGKYSEVMNYFESQFGQSLDIDSDGIGDLYQYNSIRCPLPSSSSSSFSVSPSEGKDDSGRTISLAESCEAGDYAIWATSNLLIGMIHPKDDLNYLRRLFHPAEAQAEAGEEAGEGGAVWHQQYQNQSRVESVEYPHVMVSYAHYSSTDTRNLTVYLKPGDSPPLEPQSHIVILSHIPAEAQDSLSLTINHQTDGVTYTVLSEESLQQQPLQKSHSDEEKKFIKLLVEAPGWTEAQARDSIPIVIELVY